MGYFHPANNQPPNNYANERRKPVSKKWGIIFSQPIIGSFCTKIWSFRTTMIPRYFSTFVSISDHFALFWLVC